MMYTSTLAAAVVFLGCPVWGTTIYPDCVHGPQLLTSNLVCNISATPTERAAAIIAAMNITEKLVNLVDNSLGAQKLGLHAYEWWSEALHGVANSPGVTFASSGAFSYATSFANPIVLSAAFDDDMIEAIATVVSTEARAFSNAGNAGLDFWTPNINPYRDPRWGRGMETPGEDPLRIQGYVKHLLRGLEGDNSVPIKKVVATCKHFAAYDLEIWEGNVRYGFDAKVTTQDLVEYYLPPFQQCSRDSKVGSIMCSYNSVNGIPSCANTYLLETILREHWNWTTDNQYVVSDCNAVQSIYDSHNYTSTAAQAVSLAYTAGTDNVCEYQDKIDVIRAYNESLLTEEVIDRALSRQYEALVRLGYFDPATGNPYRSLSWSDVNTPSTQKLARQSAADGMVLLKNNGILPLMQKNGTTVAMIGMWADGTDQMLGNYNGIPPYMHSPRYAAQNLGLKVKYAPGPSYDDDTTGSLIENALTVVNSSDIILYFGGIDLSVEAEGKDRTSISWPAAQLSFLSQICSSAKPCVVIQMGNQLDNTPLLNNSKISAILWAGYPGQDGGPAVFDVLTGVTPPAGRLPVTQYPADYVNEVPMTAMSLRPGANNPGRTYKWYNASVLPFGYGLHYTNFTATFSAAGNTSTQYNISSLLSSCNETYLDLCPLPPIPITVTNTGASSTQTSDFVALLFLSGSFGLAPHPRKQLISYKRLRGMNPGESRNVELEVKIGSLSRVDNIGNSILWAGTYELELDVPGQSKRSFELVGSRALLDRWPQPPNEGDLRGGD